MHDPERVRAADRGADVHHEPRKVLDRHHPLTRELLSEGLADQELHDHCRRAVLQLEHVVHLHDARVMNGTRRPSLAEEPVRRLPIVVADALL